MDLAGTGISMMDTEKIKMGIHTLIQATESDGHGHY